MRFGAIGAGLVALLLAALTPAAAAAQAAPPAAEYLVAPFDHEGSDPRGYWLTEASAVLLTDALVDLGVPAISRENRLRALARLRVPAGSPLSRATIIRVGQAVRAAHVVVGTVALDDHSIRVAARTIRLDAGRISPELVETGPLDELFDIYGRLARRIAGDARPATPSEHRYTLAAFEQYIKGLLADSPSTRIAFLTEALKLAPGFERPRLALWEVYHDQGEHRAALEAIEGVAEGHPLHRRARFLAAVSRLGLGLHQQAYDALTALNRERPDAAVLNALGIVQLRRPTGKGTSLAAAYFADAVKLDPASGDLRFNHGYAAWLEGDATTAIAALREVVRRDPADAEAHYVLGVALQASGSIAEGAREKELARRLSSELAELDEERSAEAAMPPGLERLSLAIDAPASQQVESAIVAAGQRDQRELAAFHLNAGRRHFTDGRDAEAISELRRAVYLDPYLAEAHLLLGRLYLRGGRVDDAIDALKISLWSAETVAARMALAEAYLAAREPALARAELEEVLRRDPDHAEARQLLDTL